MRQTHTHTHLLTIQSLSSTIPIAKTLTDNQTNLFIQFSSDNRIPMATAASAASSVPISVFCSTRASSRNKKKKSTTKTNVTHPRSLGGGGGGGFSTGKFGHFVDVVKKDVNFLKNRISKGIGWANETLHIPEVMEKVDQGIGWANDSLHIPEVMEKVDQFVWLRNLEIPNANPFPLPSWPQPSYPELSGVDLYMADLKALEAYLSYFYYRTKMWTKPLPEVYDPQEVADYFSCRPHLVAFRLFEVFSSFASTAIKVRISGIGKLNESNVDKEAGENISQYNFGVVLKETMLSLGPTFIKVGQSLSTRPDIIGYEISKALSELHDQIPPFPRTLAMEIIEEELGSPVEKFFSYISEEAVGAASFGQVYKASTIDGYDVALKVQRPNLRHVVIRDIYILRLGLGILQKVAKRKSDLRLYADELGKGLVGELDYTLEAANASEFMEAHSPFPFIRVPKVLPHLSKRRVLTMEWMAGENPNDLISISNTVSTERQQNDAKRRLLDLVNKGVEACLVQLIETGLLHADPHPGNLRYISPGQIGFLDFGLVCRMEKKHQFAMLASIVHIVNGDWASLVGALCEMDVVRPGTSTWRVTMDLEYALGVVDFNDGIPDIKFSRVLGKIWSVALKYHFRMPPYYTLLLRSLASLEGLAMAGDPDFKTFEAAYPYVVRKLLTDNSVGSRKILHSVVLNKRKEFQWQKLAFFLKIGGTRKGLQLASKIETSVDHSSNGPAVYDTANLVLRLLLSKDGVVLRRLVMTADGASLVQAMLSKEAISFRQQLCGVITDLLYQKMHATALGRTNSSTRYSPRLRTATGVETTVDYESIMRDRRLKVILLNILNSTRKKPVLMLRLSLVSALMILKASAIACHRMIISLAEAYLDRLSFTSKPLAVSV